MLDTKPNTEELVARYIEYRDEIAAAEEAHKQAIAKLKEPFDELAAQLLERCNDQNADSIKTASGTVSRRTSSRYWTTDWEQMYGFIKEHDAPFLLEQRIHNGNMRQFLEENPDQLPVGLQADVKYVIQVRRPNAK